MSAYRIISAGMDLGTYHGETPEEAVRAMNSEAGYASDEHVLEVTGQSSIMEGLEVVYIGSADIGLRVLAR